MARIHPGHLPQTSAARSTMLPTGHIATGVLLGLRRNRRSVGASRRLILAGAVVCTCLPDADLAIPPLLDRFGVGHRLNSGHHHSWMTHTPLFWAAFTGVTRRAADHPGAPTWAPEAARLLTAGVALHLLGDTAANTVAILWPLRRREYGLSLDRMPEEDDHLAYMRRYPVTPAGWLEGALILAAAILTARRLRSAI